MKTLGLLVVAVLLVVAFVAAQEPAAVPPADGKIMAGDLIVVTLPDLQAPGALHRQAVRVPADGTVQLLFVEKLKLGGLTLREAERLVADAYVRAMVFSQAHPALDRAEMSAKASIQPGLIAPGDVVRCVVQGLTAPNSETVLILHVSPEGDIGLPYLGQTKVGGLSEIDACETIAKIYRDKAIVSNPAIALLRCETDADAERVSRMLRGTETE